MLLGRAAGCISSQRPWPRRQRCQWKRTPPDFAAAWYPALCTHCVLVSAAPSVAAQLCHFNAIEPRKRCAVRRGLSPAPPGGTVNLAVWDTTPQDTPSPVPRLAAVCRSPPPAPRAHRSMLGLLVQYSIFSSVVPPKSWCAMPGNKPPPIFIFNFGGTVGQGRWRGSAVWVRL